MQFSLAIFLIGLLMGLVQVGIGIAVGRCWERNRQAAARISPPPGETAQQPDLPALRNRLRRRLAEVIGRSE